MSSIRLRRLRPRNSTTASSPSPNSSPSHSPASPSLSLSSTLYSWLPHVVTHPCTSMSAFFASFGTYLSTHQVPSLLLTALIICSLLSPSLLLYFVPPSSSPSVSNSPLTSRGRGELVWELEGLKRQGLISTEEPVCWDRVKKYYELTGRESGGRRLRVEQLLINVNLLRKKGTKSNSDLGGGGQRGSTISKDVLHKSWKLEKELEKRLLEGLIEGNDCLREEGNCAVLSPTKWWRDEQSLLGDEDVHETLSAPPPSRHGNESIVDENGEFERPWSLPLTLSETFVGAGRDRSGSVKTAQHLILTFFLQDVPSRSTLPPTLTSAATSSNRPPLALNSADSNSTVLEDVEREQARLHWRRAVRDVIEGINHEEEAKVRVVLGIMSESKSNLTRHVLLKFLPHLVVDAHPRRLENIIYAFGYLLVIVYVTRYIRRLRAHSKMGLIITGIAELSSSGIMSVSICWLMGWNLGLVPWNLMAFLVLTSGLDNMILVLRAISQTDLNLTVPERMAVGLRQVGVEMTVLLMVEELIAAWLLWFVEITVMRQWIRFGAVVLAVDYFLELTFFSTVLSIDIQRLELADLLAHNTSASTDSVPPESSETTKSSTMKKSSSTQKSFEGFVKGSWKVLKDRPAKTSTVAFLWVINVLLWAFYGSEHYLPATCSQTALSSDRPFLAPSLDPSLSRALRLGQTDPSAASHLSVPLGSGQAFWNLVNPNNASSVQIYLEPTISIQLFQNPTTSLDTSYSSDFDDDEFYRSPAPESLQLSRAELAIRDDGEVGVWTKVMIVVLPILMVMGLLRLLLVYLLKDAELLQARWGSEERVSGRAKDEDGSVNGEDQAEIEVVKGIEPARRQHRGDVELVANGGHIIVSWAGLEEEIQVRRRIPSVAPSSTPRPSFDRRDSSSDSPPSFATRLHIPLAADPVSIVSLAVDSEGKFCAAVTNRGRVFVWSLERGGTLVDFGSSHPRALTVAAPGPTSAKDQKKAETPAPPLSFTGSRIKSSSEPCFYSLHAEGEVVRWNCGSCEAETVAEADEKKEEDEEEIVRRQLIVPTNSFDGTTTPLLARTYKDGRLQLVRIDTGGSRRIVFDLNEGGGGSIVALSTFPIVLSVVGLVVDHSIVAVSHPSNGIIFYALSPSPSPSPSPAQIASLPPLDSPIRQIRLQSAPSDTVCSSCLETIQDGFLASISTRTTLKVYRIFTPPISASIETCACNSSVDALEASRSRAASLTVVGASPAMTRVLSNGGSSRRFSPRKKPTTPTRPVAFNSNPSSSPMPASSSTDPFLVAATYSDSNDPSTLGTPSQDRRPSFSSQQRLSPAPPPPKRTQSGTSIDEISPPSTAKSSPESPTDEGGPTQLRSLEVATVELDERSGWEVAGDRIVGLRRRKGTGWEVWTLSLGRPGSKLEEGYREGSTPLRHLLDNLSSIDEEPPSSFLAPPRNPAVRRRRSPNIPSPYSDSIAPSFDDAPSLPFSRVGPLTQSFSSSAVTVALGNQIVTLSPSKDTVISSRTSISASTNRF
ncbi:uncharacterized protein JCM6883_004942 [Sporobolomyces salmoneus]|uniref:uncharacterized protein n=1 Tax=Sporobolomyces salmoneus TaxID=183962 RepID=UPI00317CF8FD